MDIIPIIIRIKTLKGLDTDSQVAELIGLSGANFSNRKRKGSLLDPIVKWAMDERLDLNWLLMGESQDPSTETDSKSNDDLESFKVSTNNRISVLESHISALGSKIDRLLEIYDNPIEIDLDRKVSGEE